MVNTSSAASSRLVLHACGATNRGLQRSLNEDSLLAEFPVFIVADGMGGHAAGDRASAAVVDTFQPLVQRDDLEPAEVLPLVAAAQQAVAAIASGVDRGAGSTLTGIIAVKHRGERHWLVLNVGDSRVYRALADTFEQLTVDHSVAQELIDRGDLRPDEVAGFAGRNVITRAIGDGESDADYWLLPMVTGERLLVCSDGLSGELTDDVIRAELAAGETTEQTATELINAALRQGGRDNISVVIVDVVDGGISADTDAHTSGSLVGLPIEETTDRAAETHTLPSRRGTNRE